MITGELKSKVGSSPRMRGTHIPPAPSRPWDRFIPAHAGNSIHCDACWPDIRGSSPRMRGTHSEYLMRYSKYRFIPAHAGNSFVHTAVRHSMPVHPRACGELDERGRMAHPLTPVHPRACGELICGPRCLWRCSGSSPRMRGTLFRVRSGSCQNRFIPAHAGNSVVGRYVKPDDNGNGSSPRMRGTHHRTSLCIG